MGAPRQETGWKLATTSSTTDTVYFNFDASMLALKLASSATGQATVIRYTYTRGSRYNLVPMDDDPLPIGAGGFVSNSGLRDIVAISFEKAAAGDSLFYYASSERLASVEMTSEVSVSIDTMTADFSTLESKVDFTNQRLVYISRDTDSTKVNTQSLSNYNIIQLARLDSLLAKIGYIRDHQKDEVTDALDSLVTLATPLSETDTLIADWTSTDGAGVTSAVGVDCDGATGLLLELSWTSLDGNMKLIHLFTRESGDTSLFSYVADIGIDGSGGGVWGCPDTMTVLYSDVGPFSSCTIRIPLLGTGVGLYYLGVDPWDDCDVTGLYAITKVIK